MPDTFTKMESDNILSLTTAVFASGKGKELLEIWNDQFVKGELMFNTFHHTTYSIGQRDFVIDIMEMIELNHKLKNEVLK